MDSKTIIIDDMLNPILRIGKGNAEAENIIPVLRKQSIRFIWFLKCILQLVLSLSSNKLNLQLTKCTKIIP